MQDGEEGSDEDEEYVEYYSFCFSNQKFIINIILLNTLVCNESFLS